MYCLQAKVAKLVLALAVVARGAELSNATDEVEGLFVRESNASTVCGVGSPVDVRGCARVAVALQGLSEPHTGQVPLAPASRLGRQLLRLDSGGSKIQDTFMCCYGIPPVPWVAGGDRLGSGTGSTSPRTARR